MNKPAKKKIRAILQVAYRFAEHATEYANDFLASSDLADEDKANLYILF
jgi:hypothetical protein